jgi:ribosomal protein L44E
MYILKLFHNGGRQLVILLTYRALTFIKNHKRQLSGRRTSATSETAEGRRGSMRGGYGGNSHPLPKKAKIKKRPAITTHTSVIAKRTSVISTHTSVIFTRKV